MVAVPTVFIYDKNKTPYSLAEVCGKLGVSRSWLYLHRKRCDLYEFLALEAGRIPRRNRKTEQRVKFSDIAMGSWELNNQRRK